MQSNIKCARRYDCESLAATEKELRAIQSSSSFVSIFSIFLLVVQNFLAGVALGGRGSASLHTSPT
jgi:hypothetical protein